MIRYGPCGHAVDIARRPYTTACRFFRDSDRVSTIRWVQVPDDAPALPYVSAICNRELEQRPWPDDGVGEVEGAPRVFQNRRTIPGLNGNAPCGTRQDFEQGGAYLPDLPPAPYDAQGFLACCRLPPGPPPPVTVPLGINCANATALSVGVDYVTEPGVLSTTNRGWFVFEVAVGVPYRLTFSVESGPITPAALGFDGVSCANLLTLFSAPTVGCWTFQQPTAGTTYMYFFGSNVAPAFGSVRFRIDAGACAP